MIAMEGAVRDRGRAVQGIHFVSGVDEHIPIDVYIPGYSPPPQAPLVRSIMLQKKKNSEQQDLPVLGKHCFLLLVRQ